MPVAQEPLLHQAITAIKYEEGVVFLDICGSLTRDLGRQLGKGFDFKLPTVETGRGTNRTERMSVLYGPEVTSVTAEAAEEIARFTQVATWTWQQVTESMDVAKKVVRCGIRFYQLYPAATRAEVGEALRRTELAKETGPWREIFGEARLSGFVGEVHVDGWERVRVELSQRQMVVEGELSEGIRKYFPEHSVCLDTDFVLFDNLLHDGERRELRHPQLKDAIVRAWQAAKVFGEAVGKRLGT